MPINIDGTEYASHVYDGSELVPYDMVLGDGTGIFTHSPAGPTVVDDFEAGSLDSAWSGGTDAHEVSSDQAYEGTYSVAQVQTDNITRTDYTTAQGTRTTCEIYVTDHESQWSTGIIIGADAADSAGYIARIVPRDNDMRIQGRGDSDVFVSSNNTPIDASGEWYHLEFDWTNNGGLTATLYDQSGGEIESISGTDTTYTSGGIGIYSNSFETDPTPYVDYITVEDL